MKKNLIFLLVGLLISLFVLVTIRFVNYKEEEHTHYHANFGIYINGAKYDFSGNKYMEEVSACYTTGKLYPKQRVHLHEGKGDTVHVHDGGVTWEHLLINLGFNFGKDYLVDDKGNIYSKNELGDLKFFLNGKEVSDISNTLIESEDKLLVSYGASLSEPILKQQYDSIDTTAHEFNQKADPATCSGGHSDEKIDFWEKLKKSVI